MGMSAWEAPLWVSVLVFVVFLVWMVLYLTAKLDRVSRGESPRTLFEKVFGKSGSKITVPEDWAKAADNSDDISVIGKSRAKKK